MGVKNVDRFRFTKFFVLIYILENEIWFMENDCILLCVYIYNTCLFRFHSSNMYVLPTIMCAIQNNKTKIRERHSSDIRKEKRRKRNEMHRFLSAFGTYLL